MKHDVSSIYKAMGHAAEKRKERKGKKRKGEKVTFVGLEPTPSAIRADVLIQLD